MRNYFLCMLLMMLAFSNLRAQYSWQHPHSQVIRTGDIEWQPSPFVYPVKEGEEVRYIDYKDGDDNNDGKTTNSPWKHHPWDPGATGLAAEASGIQAYVFKRGVSYRLYSEGEEAFLIAHESGSAENPIKLTSDPEWGEGEAVLSGSVIIEEKWKRAKPEDVPERMKAENIWYTDIQPPLSPRKEDPITLKPVVNMWPHGKFMNEIILFEVDKDCRIHELHIASDAGWEMSNPNFAYHHWNKWDGETDMDADPENVDLQGYDEDLKGYDPDYFEGGVLWSQWGGIIATAHPYKIKEGDYDPERGILAHRSQDHPENPASPFGHWVHKDSRYLIENLPQFLDKPGEYYYDEDFNNSGKGRLFLRLPGDRNPNRTRIEMSAAWNSISIDNQSHIEISGLAFQMNGRKGNVIEILGNAENIVIRNCSFRHIANDGIMARLQKEETMDGIAVTDCDFFNVNGGSAISIIGHSGKDLNPGENHGVLTNIKILRNRARNTGLYRHNDHRWSNIPTISANYGRLMEVAGNVVVDNMGSGIVVQGGKSGKDGVGYDIPLIRIFVHHNKIEYAALGVCDYGGLSLWQHGPVYSYNNISGNSVGHWPGQIGVQSFTNLSYPIYLDGAFKIYNFNNISWSRPYDDEGLYASDRAAFFNVFGYLNPFINNTVYGAGKGIGGTSGNRNHYLGNIFAEITKEFISVNHGGNPSLIGGDDPGSSGIDGAGTLAIGHNLFHGKADAGVIATRKQGARADLQSASIDKLQHQMKSYPLAYGELGFRTDFMPIRKGIEYEKEKPLISNADFRPTETSAALNHGVKYFIPFALYATVAEWHFNQNHSNPELILDYHHYPTEAYFHRSMYYKVPAYELRVNQASMKDYIYSDSENWIPGALSFHGDRYASLSHENMSSDVLINIQSWQDRFNYKLPAAPWMVPEPTAMDEKAERLFGDDQYLRYPGSLRKSLDMHDNNFLIEAIIKVRGEFVNGTIAEKYDGNSGYSLKINEEGKLEFLISSNGEHSSVTSSKKINNEEWHHIIAEVDRGNEEMIIYLNGQVSQKAGIQLPGDYSLSNKADFLVGKDYRGENYLIGAIDFMRISRGNLADAQTTIDELYEWQFNGPMLYDFNGNAPNGRRDAGAIELND